jgi:hypothetical protein
MHRYMVSFLNRRGEERYALVSPVQLAWTDSEKCQRQVSATSINVSLYGMMLEVQGHIEVGTEVRVHIGERWISSKARVRHLQPSCLGFRIGIQFDATLLAEHIPSLDAVLIQSLRHASENAPGRSIIANASVV